MPFLISIPVSFVVLRIWLMANPAERKSISISQIFLAYVTAFVLVHGIVNKRYSYVLFSSSFFLAVLGSEVWLFRKTWAEKWHERQRKKNP